MANLLKSALRKQLKSSIKGSSRPKVSAEITWKLGLL
jgi:hypothetical protein